MNTIVVDGEPIVYGDVWVTAPFERFVQGATGEQFEQPKVASQVYKLIDRKNKEQNKLYERCRVESRIPVHVTERHFHFLPTECCAEDRRLERYDSEYSVPVRRKGKYGGHVGHRRIRGCRCARCSDDPCHYHGWNFLQKVTRVEIEI